MSSTIISVTPLRRVGWFKNRAKSDMVAASELSKGELFMKYIIAILASGLLAAPAPVMTGCLPGVHDVQGQRLYCCTLSNGQRCCSEGLTPDGKVMGCAC